MCGLKPAGVVILLSVNVEVITTRTTKRLLRSVDYTQSLPKEKETALKINISWSFSEARLRFNQDSGFLQGCAPLRMATREDVRSR
jgi:hypothetical protein